MGTHAESESLSDIDDLEVDRYLHNEKERQYKKIIWEKLNWEFLNDQAASKKGFFGKIPEGDFHCLMGNKKRQTQVTKGQLDPKGTQALRKKRLSSKVNFDMVEKLFGEPDTQAVLENPKKARFEPCSENHDNLESQLQNKNRGDDERESLGEFEEEMDDMGGLYENTCYDNDVDEGYNYEDDDDYNFE